MDCDSYCYILVEVTNQIRDSFVEHEIIINHLFDLLKTSRSSDDLQFELCDLLGFERFDLISLILENRDTILKGLSQSEHEKLKKVNRINEIKTSTINMKNSLAGSNFSFQVKEDTKLKKDTKKLGKKIKKEMKELYRNVGEDERKDIELAIQESLKMNDDLTAIEESFDEFVRNKKENNIRLPYVFSNAMNSNRITMLMSGYKMVLPQGSIRKDFPTYEEVSIPPISQNNSPDNDINAQFSKLPVSEMDSFCARGFLKFKHLNIIQSVVYEQAFKSNENLLICAPTGAGKTNIAMLTIMKCIADHCDDCGNINKGEFKIIYICPMKALASEMTESFGKRLAHFGLQVKELTGDTNLTKKEMDSTNMLILTPEKWDVISRKSNSSDESGSFFNSNVKLMIIDEVHLLNDDRGAVIEAIVARALREMVICQKKIRFVGLSATLPNYEDAAEFLQVDKMKGLFMFDDRFRPVPLDMTFIGVKKQVVKNVSKNPKNNEKKNGTTPAILPDNIEVPPQIKDGPSFSTEELLDRIAYDKVKNFVNRKQQVLVFVHARNATWRLAEVFRECAATNNELEDFLVENIYDPEYVLAKKRVEKLKNNRLLELFCLGFGVHHAGMQRSERNIIESMFLSGYISVLFCTATLAWGVNLPASAVVIRGTDVFDSSKGVMSDLSILDVQQIFGRAGRPQFNEKVGYGVIISHHSKMSKYLGMLSHSTPIESQFVNKILDNLNAEIARGSVTNIKEAVSWIRSTFYYIRAKKNPLVYGISYIEIKRDPDLEEHLIQIVYNAARKLNALHMIVFDSINGFMSPTDLGRIASNFYVSSETMEIFLAERHMENVTLEPQMTEGQILSLLSEAAEFTSLKIRDDDIEDLQNIKRTACKFKAKCDLTYVSGKVNILLQSYISRYVNRNFTLNGETLYIIQNAPRLCRALFEISLKKGWLHTTVKFLTLTRCIENRLWHFDCPLRQIDGMYSETILKKLEQKNLSYYDLYEMEEKEISELLRVDAKKVYDGIRMLPMLEVEGTVKPITHSIIQINVILSPLFNWSDKLFGKDSSTQFWLFIENVNENRILHHELINFPKKKVYEKENLDLTITIPINDTETNDNYQIRIAHNFYLVEDYCYPISMHNCIFPISNMTHTDLLPLDPLPIRALKNPKYESLYSFEYFNPIQTQLFFKLYHTSEHVLVGAPTGSGKTLCAELAIFHTLNKDNIKRKVVYIAPLKALVRERVDDWKSKMEKKLNISVVEISGDYTPSSRTLERASILVTTPEKWDGIMRSWETRRYVKNVDCVIIDEIHLLGVERGAVVEAFVTRLKMINEKRRKAKIKNLEEIRIVGLSTALANAGDVAEWLGVKEYGLFNFRSSVRPVPISIHIAGFPGIHYCPRMALMNKPAFNAIKTYSPKKPVLIFVASRRQTRITAQSFIPLLSLESDPTQWVNMTTEEMELLLATTKDEYLRLTLPFGIGMHHAGLNKNERTMVEKLFIEKKIQVLVTTATLAWGINCPAHLVIVKGTEYYDGKKGRYVDFPVTDIMQMVGRAGRPQFDQSAVAVIYCQDIKKNFYKNFLYSPFPVESSLLEYLPNHINAEICAGIIKNKQDAMDYLSGTYFYRRLFNNPSFYGVEEATKEGLIEFLVQVIDNSLQKLFDSCCIKFADTQGTYLKSTPYGKIASNFYLQHTSIKHMLDEIGPNTTIEELIQIMSDMPEYSEVPVRHNEDVLNEEISRQLPLRLGKYSTFDSSHTKVFLMYQAHFSRFQLPVDYKTDLRSCLDSCLRIIQAMYEYTFIKGYLRTSINVLILQQMIIQGRWHYDHYLLSLPYIDSSTISSIGENFTIPLLQRHLKLDNMEKIDDNIRNYAFNFFKKRTVLDYTEIRKIIDILIRYPIVNVDNITISPLMKRNIILPTIITNFNDKEKITLDSSTSYSINLKLSFSSVSKFDNNIVYSKFSKQKAPGYIVILANSTKEEFLATSRINSINDTFVAKLLFITPKISGVFRYTIYIFSDSYLGIDQEYNFFVNIQ
uniref:U5 small nuclear ribonucleoprotein 200 kDa helicase n=1 Tax=Strongyloides venezuelensis TaxID=75913 RepID=A0A0K0FM75_STRVS